MIRTMKMETRKLVLESRLWEEYPESTLEDYFDGDWIYLSVDKIVCDLKKRDVNVSENDGQIVLGERYVLAGRQQDLAREEVIDDNFTYVRKQLISPRPTSPERELKYPNYAHLGLFDKSTSAVEDKVIIEAFKAAVTKNVLEIYFKNKNVELPEGYK